VADDDLDHATELVEHTEFDGAPTDVSRATAPSGDTPAPRLHRGAVIGRYVVLEVSGEGGMGVVYAAYDPQLDRRVAIKLLRPARNAGSRGRARLLREAQAIARISHPNVVGVHDVGAHGDDVFIAMEFVEGQTLTRWLQRTKPEPPELLAMMVQAGRGLAAAHAAGIVHRDFKPDNVLVGKDGRPRVLDFGLARGQLTGDSMDSSSASGSGSRASLSQLDNELTAEGAVMGTPAYMAPEQHVGQRATPATDQFAFCICLYQGLYGHRPFLGATARDLAKATLRGEIRPVPPGSKVPSDLRAVVLRGLSPRTEDRHPTMVGLLRELTRDRRGRRRQWMAALGGLAIVVAVAGLSYASGARREGDPCGATGSAADEVWNDARKRSVAAAFMTSGVADATAVWSRAEVVLDDYVVGWRAQELDACRATHVQGTQSAQLLDRRMACLSKRLTHVDALLETFSDPDAGLVGNAVTVVHAIPTLDECSDVEALVAGVAPPATEAIQARVDEADLALAWATARASVGRFDDAIERLTPWLSEAEQLGYLPLTARIRHRLGSAYQSLRDPKGLEFLQKAFVEALEAGDDRVVMMAGIDIAQALGDSERRGEEALWILDVVEAVIRRAQPPDLAIPVGASNARAVIYIRQGRFEEAGDLFRRSVGLLESDPRPSPNKVVTLSNLGGYYAERRQLALARDYLRQAQEVNEALFGPDHASMQDMYQNLGVIALLQQDYPEAERWLRRALTVARKSLDADHPDVARTLSTLGVVARHRGDLESAEKLQREALAIQRSRLGDEHPGVAEALRFLANTVNERGDHAAAITLAQEAVAIVEARLSPTDPESAMAYEVLGGVLAEGGRFEEALSYADRALEVIGGDGEGDARDLAALEVRARALRGLRRYADAREAHQRAIDIALRGETPLAAAYSRFALAKTMIAEDPTDITRALELARQARTAYVAADSDPLTVREIDEFLATHAPE
jgi:tetratricopeptide (TPR) repeat protein/predicted Ser/Thr protein kinase